MSNALALAAVTAVLKDLLDNGLVDQSISEAVGGPVTVSVLAPDHIETGDGEDARLNLFLYHVAPNAALRNADLPTRDVRGGRRAASPLALDLHYMLSAYGGDDYEAEILLGYAMLMLHESPVISRGAIRRALREPSPVDGGMLPPAVGALAASDLAEQLELVRVTPHGVSVDEMAKLWTAFQARYRPSAAYTASVVLIERVQPVMTPLPVLSIGEVDEVSGRPRGVVVQPSLLPPYPLLQTAEPPAGQTALRIGETLTLRGSTLAAAHVVIRFTHLRSGRVLELEADALATNAVVTVTLPAASPAEDEPNVALDPASWAAGLYSVEALLTDGATTRLTNALPVMLAPRIEAIAAAAAAEPGESIVTVQVAPPVRRQQRARLVVGTTEFTAAPFDEDAAETLEFLVSGEFAGPQWVRLRVDDAESLLIDRSAEQPAFDATHRVTLP